MDQQYQDLQFKPSEIQHEYGSNIHILSNPLLLTYLNELSKPETVQPNVNHLIEKIYTQLFETVINHEFPRVQTKTATRMAEAHPKEAIYSGPIIDPKTHVITVNLARAGTLPSHICYSLLNELLQPENVRQDHISIARQTNDENQVTGAHLSGHKIGGSIDESILLIPDPMGATGGTILKTLEQYQEFGKPKKVITLHCMVTPEYLKTIQAHAPEIQVYTARLDRGLSDLKVLKTTPGHNWEKEKGLNQDGYIVPGAGGIGEILNNAFV